MRWPEDARFKTVTAALLGAAAAVLAGVPLPWFVGPLLAVAAGNIAGARLPSLPFARDVGQWIIGVALGLYFTPDVVRQIVRLAPWIAGTVAFAVLLGLAGAWALRRLTGESGTTCFFAMAIGGASEMAAQAERYGGRVDRVAAAHSLRIMMVAVIVPFAMQAVGVSGSDPYAPAARQFDAVGFAVLVAVTGGGAVVLQRLRTPNVYMLGPLVVTAALTASGQSWSALPAPVLNGGQLLIGVALGARFTPAFFRAAPRYLLAVAGITLAYLAAAAAFGAGVARAAGLSTATAILATTPGGIGEMAITAKVLALGAPVVTAFHGIRMALLVVLIGPLFRFLRWAATWRP
ncbi:MAG: AbrB family transcriptional regulator [Burkholderiaceae bacterium]|nr:AbrB family transcriptional regulator [Burkholderiaceae bacterium]